MFMKNDKNSLESDMQKSGSGSGEDREEDSGKNSSQQNKKPPKL